MKETGFNGVYPIDAVYTTTEPHSLYKFSQKKHAVTKPLDELTTISYYVSPHLDPNLPVSGLAIAAPLPLSALTVLTSTSWEVLAVGATHHHATHPHVSLLQHHLCMYYIWADIIIVQ